MIKSELILPLRIYDNFYDQRRFEKTCQDVEGCEQEFIVSSAEMPKFQFKRESSLHEPVSLILRNICKDPLYKYYKIAPEGADTFNSHGKSTAVYGAFPKTQLARVDQSSPPTDAPAPIVTFNDCGGITMGDLTGFDFSVGVVGGDPALLVLPGLDAILPIPYKYLLKLTVDEFEAGGGNTFEIRVYNGDPVTGELLLTITAAGDYGLEFHAVNGNNITLEFYSPQIDSNYVISYLQVTSLTPTRLGAGSGDFAMDEAVMKIHQLADGNDIVTFCADNTDYKIPAGTYYYILNMGHAEYYYSELFTVKPAVELLKYYRLTWFNQDNDIPNIIYNFATLACILRHTIYLDAGLINPQYLTDIDSDKNGDGDLIETFKRWQKTIVFDITKSPPHLTDALSAMFLYQFVTLRKPSGQYQDTENNEDEILRVEAEVNDVLNNCFQHVKLTLTLADVFIQTNCPEAVEQFDCGVTPGTPLLLDVTDLGGFIYVLGGSTAVPGSFVVVEYNCDGGGWITTQDFNMVQDDGFFGVIFDASLIAGGCTDLDIRIANKTLACNFNTSAPYDLI